MFRFVIHPVLFFAMAIVTGTVDGQDENLIAPMSGAPLTAVTHDQVTENLTIDENLAADLPPLRC